MKYAKKILVPTDFSPCSENALVYAIHFAEKTGAVIHLLNVATIDVKETENPFSAERVVEEKTKSILNALRETVDSVKKKLGGKVQQFPEIKTTTEIGSASLKIADWAKGESIDLIIMGTQGENSIADRLLGSTASNLVKESPVPLIVIPERADFSEPINLGYASNLEDGDPFRIWKATQLLQPAAPDALHCVHFSESVAGSEERLAEFEAFFKSTLPALKIDFSGVKTEDKIQALNNFCAENEINLMVMYRTTRNLWQALFKESFTEEMAKQVFVPLLILKDEKPK